MTRHVAVVLPDAGRAPGALLAALAEAGLRATRLRPADAERWTAARVPDLAGVLVPASLGPVRALRIGRRLRSPGPPSALLVYTEHDLAALEACARAGLDYVLPPFLPGLLRVRLDARRRVDGDHLARLTEQDRELDEARRMQAAFLPDRPPVIPGWQVSARLRPARPMSGDFYDWFPMGDGGRLGVVVADVCDKGYGAALLMTPLRTLIRHEAASADRGDAPLRAAADAVNRYLLRDHPGQGHFATLFFAMLDPSEGRLRYVNAGHHPPLLLRARGTHERLRTTGPAVGLFEHARHEVAVDHLNPGDFLLGYTDGLVEARSAEGVSYGAQRVLSAARTTARESAEGLLAELETDLDHHLGPLAPQDDLTLLAVHRLPAAEGDLSLAP